MHSISTTFIQSSRIYRYNKDDVLFKFRFPRGYQTDWIQITIEIKRSCHLTYYFNVVTCNLKKFVRNQNLNKKVAFIVLIQTLTTVAHA